MTTLILQALDVLVLRASKLFGAAGSRGELLMPPWPSVAAGALRSRMLADAGINLTDFAKGKVDHAELGTPAKPGSFRLTDFTVAIQVGNGWDVLRPLPADLTVQTGDDGQDAVHALQPQPVGWAQTSHVLPLLPLLPVDGRGKPVGGYWLNGQGWADYLAGKTPTLGGLIKTSELWAREARVGIALDAATGRPAEGALFTTEALALKNGVGFVVRVEGATPPQTGLLRLGGDGHAVTVAAMPTHTPTPAAPPASDFAQLAAAQRIKLVLTSPGLFAAGWLPGDAASAEGAPFDCCGVRGRIVAGAVPRAEVVSGWDLAQRTPKTAQRIAPTGSVYWLDLQPSTPPDALHKLVAHGLWPETGHDAPRQAEGFNRVALAQAINR